MIYPDWPAAVPVKAVTTTRHGGVSTAPYDSLNLADHVGDAAGAVRQNRLSIQQQLKLPGWPSWLNQVHGNTVVDAASSGERQKNTNPSIILMTLFTSRFLSLARCLPTTTPTACAPPLHVLQPAFSSP